MSENDLDQIIKEEYKFFSEIPGFQAVGVGDGCIVVYVKNKKYLKNVPKEINDIPICVSVMGILRPAKG